MKKTLLILMGCPGSGKSTYADKVATRLNRMFGLRVAVCCADDFFINNQGQYNFDRTKLGAAHDYCRDQARKNMRSGCNLVIIANTSVSHKERLPYIEMAKEWDYRIKQKLIGGVEEADVELYFKRNVHGVPLATIKSMAERIKSGMKK